MTKALLNFLEGCPYTPGIREETLGPGVGTGLFFRGIDSVAEDIMGNKKPRFTFIVRHRGQTNTHWADRFCRWIMAAFMEGYTVTPKRGGRCSPTRDGFSTWEVELTVTQQS